jgi:hypothetical protein
MRREAHEQAVAGKLMGPPVCPVELRRWSAAATAITKSVAVPASCHSGGLATADSCLRCNSNVNFNAIVIFNINIYPRVAAARRMGSERFRQRCCRHTHGCLHIVKMRLLQRCPCAPGANPGTQLSAPAVGEPAWISGHAGARGWVFRLRRGARRLSAASRWATAGTPIESRLDELWMLFQSLTHDRRTVELLDAGLAMLRSSARRSRPLTCCLQSNTCL